MFNSIDNIIGKRLELTLGFFILGSLLEILVLTLTPESILYGIFLYLGFASFIFSVIFGMAILISLSIPAISQQIDLPPLKQN